MSDKLYGFYTEKYTEDFEIETLMTGDGKSQFTDSYFPDGTASIGISYGRGTGVGTQEHHNCTTNPEMGIKWQVKFESQESVDAMINTLLRVKNNLANGVPQEQAT